MAEPEHNYDEPPDCSDFMKESFGEHTSGDLGRRYSQPSGKPETNSSSGSLPRASPRGATWTPERVDLCKHLWTVKQLSATEIARKLGRTTRNAVLGFLHRAGLLGQRKASSNKPRKPKSKPRTGKWSSKTYFTFGAATLPRRKKAPGLYKSASNPSPERLVAPAPLFIPVHERVSILDVHNGQCRFPLDHPGQPTFGLCGKQTRDGMVYCSGHMGICYLPAVARKHIKPSPRT